MCVSLAFLITCVAAEVFIALVIVIMTVLCVVAEMENFIGSATKTLQQLFNAHSRFRSCDVAVRKYTNYVLCKCGILEERANSLIGSSCDEDNPDINIQGNMLLFK